LALKSKQKGRKFLWDLAHKSNLVLDENNFGLDHAEKNFANKTGLGDFVFLNIYYKLDVVQQFHSVRREERHLCWLGQSLVEGGGLKDVDLDGAPDTLRQVDGVLKDEVVAPAVRAPQAGHSLLQYGLPLRFEHFHL